MIQRKPFTQENYFLHIARKEELYDNKHTWSRSTKKNLEKFEKIEQSSLFLSFSLWAFLFPCSWFLWRRMYLHSLGVLCANGFLGFFVFRLVQGIGAMDYYDSFALGAFLFGVLSPMNFVTGFMGRYFVGKAIKQRIERGCAVKRPGWMVLILISVLNFFNYAFVKVAVIDKDPLASYQECYNAYYKEKNPKKLEELCLACVKYCRVGRERSADILSAVYANKKQPLYNIEKAWKYKILSAKLGYYRALFQVGLRIISLSKTEEERMVGVRFLKKGIELAPKERLKNLDYYMGKGFKQKIESALGEPLLVSDR